MKRWAHPVHGWHCSNDDEAMIAAGWAVEGEPAPVAPESAPVAPAEPVEPEKRKPGRPKKG